MKSVLMYMLHGEGKTPESEHMKPDHFVGKFYVLFGQAAGESEAKEKELLDQAQELLLKWEAGDSEVRKIWKQMNVWWYEGVKQTYAKEGSTFDEVDYESEIFDKGRELVLEGVSRGVFAKEEDGSVSVDLTEEGLDKKYLLRKDGTTIYITQDMYLWHVRNERHAPDAAFVTTAIEQSYHFAVLKKLFELLGYPWARNFRHLPYEHVYLGKNKMSSRGGNTVSSDELFSQVKDKVRQVMQSLQKIKESSDNEELVGHVALGAIKYAYLKYDTNTRIYFDIDQTISLEGNTGPYVQYAHSRIKSILKKAASFSALAPSTVGQPEALALMKKLLHYNETVLGAAAEYKPSLLVTYLYELAALLGSFYGAVPVLATENQQERSELLTLLSATAATLKHGLHILGIEAPEEM
jgi:arginyl-tRNA synthetase